MSADDDLLPSHIGHVLMRFIPDWMHTIPEVKQAITNGRCEILAAFREAGWRKLSNEEHMALFRWRKDCIEEQGYQDGLAGKTSWTLSESNLYAVYMKGHERGKAERLEKEKSNE